MKEITIKVYSFNELSTDAQQRALDGYRENSYIYYDDAVETVKAIADKCNWRAKWDADAMGAKVEFSPSWRNNECMSLAGRRAMAYIVNNYIFPAQDKKGYYKTHCGANGKITFKKHYSKIFVSNSGTFTGYCMDDCFYQAYKTWLSMVRNSPKNTTVKDFMDIVSDYLAADWTADIEYQQSDEYIKDFFDANDVEFYADGSVF